MIPRLPTLEREDFNRYLLIAEKGEWPKELIALGISKPDLDRNDIQHDEDLTGWVYVNFNGKRYMGVWSQVVRIAEEYSRSIPRPHWWNHRDWQFTSIQRMEEERVEREKNETTNN